MVADSTIRAVRGSAHPHPSGYKKLSPTEPSTEITVTLMLRRKVDHVPLSTKDIRVGVGSRPSREAFAAERGADPDEMQTVVDFAQHAGLQVIETDLARRTVIVHGSVGAINSAFGVQIFDYTYARGTYHSHDGEINLPSNIADIVEAVVGLTNRKVLAKHFSTAGAARKRQSMDPVNTTPLTPLQVASLYNFPLGDGTGQTIGLYEMETEDGPAGYTASDIAGTMVALGNLPIPKIIDVAVDGTENSGSSDGETGLDITVAGAIAPGATIAVYFAGSEVQNIIHALQMMIHPNASDPVPTVISISYGWGPDDLDTPNFSDAEWTQLTSLFEDAATNRITVLVSSGDSGAYVGDDTQAQTSYPASDVWVTACGGTTIGNVSGSSFDEYVWNDVSHNQPGATGGGVSARFPVPEFQGKVSIPKRIGTGTSGRGVPDIAGNASENSGYLQVIGGSKPSPVGGTSAVAPLYAGLIARINANLGHSVGFLNTTLYDLPSVAFRGVSSPPGPANNGFGHVQGYPATAGWNACAGLGSLKGQALQTALGTSLKLLRMARS